MNRAMCTSAANGVYNLQSLSERTQIQKPKNEFGFCQQNFEDRNGLLLSIRTCSKQRNLHRGTILHTETTQRGLDSDAGIAAALISMYSRCHRFAEAQSVFDQLSKPSIACWTSLLSSYVQQGLGHRALDCLEKMQANGLSPDAFTYSCILKGCASLGLLDKGEEIHAIVKKKGLLTKNIILGTALVDMYAKCGLLEKAQNVFDELPERDVISWNALISGYTEQGLSHRALFCFKNMQDEGIAPDEFTCACILKACGNFGIIEKGREIHVMISNRSFIRIDTVLGTALVDMYAKCGSLSEARAVFNGLPARDVATWTVLISGYAEQGWYSEALECFERMQDKGHIPDVATYVSALKACGIQGLIIKGQKIHDEVKTQGLLEDNTVLGTALVDMYAKCGELQKAEDVFHSLQIHNTVSWTALISGYTQAGQFERVFNLFREMILEDIVPNEVTFVVLLSVCSHRGLVEDGEMYFETMKTVYSLTPTVEHYVCMVDLYSRVGIFEKALIVIKNGPFSDCRPLWSALLAGCQKWLNADLGKLAFEHLIQLDRGYASAYISISNIYTDAGMYGEAYKTESLGNQA